MEEAVQSGPVSGFGKKLSSILNTCLSEYVYFLLMQCIFSWWLCYRCDLIYRDRQSFMALSQS